MYAPHGEGMKVAVLGNQARAMSNFWTVLLRRLVAGGHDVVCLTPLPDAGDEPEWEERLLALGVRLAHYPLDRKGLNPLRDMGTVTALRRIFRQERPDILFAYTIKPVIYGAFAAALAGFPAKDRRFLMITGLGYMFEGGTPLKRLLTAVARLLYRSAFSCAGTVFFQNADDRALFERFSIVPPGMRVLMSRGTGVDTSHFSPEPLPHSGPPVLLFVGRLIEAKGLRELAAAARRLKQSCPEAVVRLLGPLETGPGAVPLAEVDAWRREGIVEYAGATQDVRPFIASARAVVLPSWREGTPCSLMEAMSMGRAVVAADAPGSREVVRHEENGLLVPVRDSQALAAALERLAKDASLAENMGGRGRALMEELFSAGRVAGMLAGAMGLDAERPF